MIFSFDWSFGGVRRGLNDLAASPDAFTIAQTVFTLEGSWRLGYYSLKVCRHSSLISCCYSRHLVTPTLQFTNGNKKPRAQTLLLTMNMTSSPSASQPACTQDPMKLLRSCSKVLTTLDPLRIPRVSPASPQPSMKVGNPPLWRRCEAPPHGCVERLGMRKES